MKHLSSHGFNFLNGVFGTSFVRQNQWIEFYTTHDLPLKKPLKKKQKQNTVFSEK